MDLIEKAAKKLSGDDKLDEKTKKSDESQTSQKENRSSADSQSSEYVYMELDMKLLQEKQMVVPDGSRNNIKEEFRVIKRPLLLNASGKGSLKSDRANLVMVTSSKSGEGKTFTAINLAMSLATEKDSTVLLVDCDVVRPSVSQFFGLDKNLKGLTDYLNDDAELNDVIIRTNLPGFRLMTAGTPHHLSNELLASEKMEQLMLELSRRYSDRVIILDSPPLLLTTEATILSRHVGQIIVVVQANRTKQAELNDAISRLNLREEVAAGLVLNKANREMDRSYYGIANEKL